MKKLLRFIKENYFLFIFAFIIFFVVFVSFYKLFISKPTYIYAKVKLGQGLWWASTAKPSIWFINSLKKGEKQLDLTNKSIAEIISLNYYPIFWTGIVTQFSNQYDTYLDLKLKVSRNKTGGYSFQRSAIAVGAPIDLEFPSTQFSGTVIGLSDKPFNEKLVEKTVILLKKSVDENEFNSIKIGSSYFDGENEVIKILDKSFDGSNITVKALFKLKEKNNQLLLGEEEIITIGKKVNVLTSNAILFDYKIEKVED